MNPAEKKRRDDPAFELKGSALTLMVLFLLDADGERLERQLQQKFAQSPGFFRSAPLLLDLAGLPETGPELDLAALVKHLRALDLVPVALRGGNPAQQRQAVAAHLGLLPALRGESAAAPAVAAAAVEAAPPVKAAAEVSAPVVPGAPAAPGTTKIVSHTIRSGQRVVAPDGDLLILGSVNSGAEILARGSIHVYGALRGRALAGVQGETAARICCLQFHPELVAIAGEYLLYDEFDPAHLGKSAVVALRADRLQIDPLGTFVPLAG